MRILKTTTSIFIALVIGLMFLTSCFQTKKDVVSEYVTIKIGVASFDDDLYGHNSLKNLLEARSDIEIEFVELISSDVRSTEEYVNRIDLALQNGEIDMVIGLPSYLTPQLILNNRLLDITDDLVNLENIHKGVVDIAKTIGNGRVYFISPIIQDIALVFSNQEILSELGLDNLPDYIGWKDFLNSLAYCNTEIDIRSLGYSPLALSVGAYQGEDLMIAHEFLQQHTILSRDLTENNVLSQDATELFDIYAKVVAQYGKTENELLNGMFPSNLIFTEGNFAYMVGDVSVLELLLNSEYNNEFNADSPFEIKADFPIGVSIINFDGSQKQNIKETSIIINRNTEHKDITLELLNFFMGKELAHNMIENRAKHSYFTPFRYTFPSYHDEETIKLLNEIYDNGFNASLLYDVEHGNTIAGMYITNRELIELLNEGFTQVYNAQANNSDNDLEISIVEAIRYINNGLNFLSIDD